ncbi:hypothetical protein L1987_72212 [Smallanthus sonchifolius]|uniref:Uncharacterized protein n=1 Tax=Smallanthus sonchifolius TaxID=185202 RepID=A0ACB9AU75_9ASTR|nr:hypothetical protein L1987_72212 [Smallanthus sonchifolius]
MQDCWNVGVFCEDFVGEGLDDGGLGFRGFLQQKEDIRSFQIEICLIRFDLAQKEEFIRNHLQFGNVQFQPKNSMFIRALKIIIYHKGYHSTVATIFHSLVKLNEQKNLKELDHLRHLSSYLGARKASTLGGTMLGYYPVRILPSKTVIAPVNPTFLP